MARSETQISAFVSKTTKEELERYAEAHGLKKGHLVEEALLHHLQALKAIPEDVILPVRVVVSRASGRKVLARLKKPRKPTAAMRSLLAGPAR